MTNQTDPTNQTEKPDNLDKIYDLWFSDASNFRDRFLALTEDIPESGGVAFTTIYYKGLAINYTARSLDPMTTLMAVAKTADMFKRLAPDHVVFEKPIPPAPQSTIPVTTEDGQTVKTQSGETATIQLPQGTRLFEVASFFHDKLPSSQKDVLKVITVNPPYNTRYGVTCFHGGPQGWKAWPLGVDSKFSPMQGFRHVIIRDPVGEGKFAEVVEFRE